MLMSTNAAIATMKSANNTHSPCLTVDWGFGMDSIMGPAYANSTSGKATIGSMTASGRKPAGISGGRNRRAGGAGLELVSVTAHGDDAEGAARLEGGAVARLPKDQELEEIAAAILQAAAVAG